MHRPPASAFAVMTENRRRYERLAEVAQVAAGEPEAVLRRVAMAAAHAWRAPNGLLTDHGLERLVIDASRPGRSPEIDTGRATGRVLHVLTEGYTTGGHTRLAWRWIARDPRVSDVALTAQRGSIPDRLRKAATASGGECLDLAAASSSYVERARALRARMDLVDLVVLHVHPHDSIALAAVNMPGPRPPVILENHADHTFWLGAGAADLVSNFRVAADRVCTELRGIPASRVGLLALPIDLPSPSITGEEMRKQLGLPEDAVVAVTVAATHKVAATWGLGMAALIDRALTWSPELHVVLAGTDETGDWAKLRSRYGDRIRALGFVPEPDPFYDLADIYLDSYPTRAGTSPLEAALLGVPVLTIEDMAPDDPAAVFQGDSPGLAGNPRVRTREQYALELRRLVGNAGRRREAGDAIRAAVTEHHCGPGWSSALEDLYARAARLSAVDLDDLTTPPEHERYGALLTAFESLPPVSLKPDAVFRTLGLDTTDGDVADHFAASFRELGPQLQVRVDPGWELHDEWASRLLHLAATFPRLAVSLPFAGADDVRGSRTEAHLLRLLAAIGRNPDDCGDISVESTRPVQTGPAVSDDLPHTDDALDWLARLLASPCWSAHPRSLPVGADRPRTNERPRADVGGTE